MYSDIKQGEHESTDQLDQCIKDLVERCQYKTEDEKMIHRTALLFHATKHLEVKKMGQIKEKEREHHVSSPPPTCQGAWDDSKKTSTDTSPMVELPQQQPLMRSQPSTSRKVTANGSGKTCSRCGQSHPPRECPAWGKYCHKCGNKNHFSTYCRSRSRHRRHTSEDLEDRSRSRSATWSAHSIEQNSFQDHPELHGRHSFQDHQESNDFVTKTFHTIYRSKLVASISNEMDPEGKTKILTILNIKIPHRNVIDNMRVKVDDGAEANILPLDSFRTMFPHALNKHGYPKDGFLRGSRTNLGCYDDGKLTNPGSIKLRLQHYSDKSFQDHYFYIVETETWKKLLLDIQQVQG